MISRILTLKKNILKNEKILIYGSDEQGVALSRFLNESKNLTTVNFIENHNYKKKQVIGIKIIGFNEFIQKYNDSNIKIYISYERNTNDFHKAIKNLNNFINNVRILSSNQESIKKEFRKLELGDFFIRDEIKNLSEDVINTIQNNVVAITGGGGSIGGKLAEKVCELRPRTLILIDFHEFSLVKIKNKLDEQCRNNKNHTTIKTILLNISDTKKLNTLLKENKIDILYHCAAYKHVDVSEDDKNFNIFIENNFINSKKLIILCLKNKVKNFILVSTDKAVEPSNVMGATKRLCEIYLLEIIKRLKLDNYKIVRFGNVFRSSGSVIPLFEKQIQEKGEITITDPNVKRFFMSINEAGLLILESTVIKNKNLLILEMGEQIKILDIANLLIKINEYKNIKINYIGLKKGEKMKEKLSNTPLERTNNPSIYGSSENINVNTFVKLKKFEKNYLNLDLKTKKLNLEQIIKY
ncbi:polysaccharide biosynthesis protein [Alphaproteobacteria bacterium]|nr:polysaccharide biosynthesis protein [Alphaproteobacteria bacterium]